MALNIQILALCLLPLVSVCRTDDDQSPAAAWRLSPLPLSRAARQVDRHPRQHTKDESDGSHDGPEHQSADGRSYHWGKSSSNTAVQKGQNLPVVSVRKRPSLLVQLGSRKRSLPVSLKPGASGAARRAAHLAADRSSLSPQPSPTASRRADTDINTVLRYSLSQRGRRRPPPGSYVVRLPPGGVRGRPYLFRLPAGHRGVPPGHHAVPPGHRAVPPPHKRRRVVLIVPVRGAGRGWAVGRRPAVAPVRDFEGNRPAVVPVIRDSEGRYRPPGNSPPLQRHQVLTPQKVYTLDNPRLRKSAINGYGPPKRKDVISCPELDVSDCYV